MKLLDLITDYVAGSFGEGTFVEVPTNGDFVDLRINDCGPVVRNPAHSKVEVEIEYDGKAQRFMITIDEL